MRISEVHVEDGIGGFSQFHMNELGPIVVLAGENGSGKTRLMKLIERTVRANIQQKDYDGCNLTYSENLTPIARCDIEDICVLNYSHSDLPLQLPDGFPPYVIDISEENLKKTNCDFDETAREALLYLMRLAKYADDSTLNTFNNEYCFPLLGTRLTKRKHDGQPCLFNLPLCDFKEKPLSPGQTYLLRLCVALNSTTAPENTILFLDEPESHLHPKALLELLDKLQLKFKLGQIWIATHSIEILSNFWYSSVWYMDCKHKNNKCKTAVSKKKVKNSENSVAERTIDSIAKKMGSKNELILNNILGDESKRYLLYQFISSPDAYACNTFAVECLFNPEVVEKANSEDPSTALAKGKITPDAVVIDFGAGKGRFLTSCTEQMGMLNFEYFAYDKYGYNINDGSETESSLRCKEVLRQHGIDEKTHYFGSEAEFDGLPIADRVLLINVLHEISPSQWADTFHRIEQKLNDDGFLIVVEREELTIGEKPFDSDFFVMQRDSMAKLLSCQLSDFGFFRHNKSSKVIAFIIPKKLLTSINKDTIDSAIFALKEIAKSKITEIKTSQSPHNSEEVEGNLQLQRFLWDQGISLAFWTHQYANASLYMSQ